jgi:PadR family transcriptional regulator PadR
MARRGRGFAVPEAQRAEDTMSSFSDKGLLGELEQLVLLAALRIPDDAYAVSIRNEIQARTGVALSRSSVYVTLDRLDRKGYVRSWLGDPTPERGGKAKRCFEVTAAGRRAIAEAERAVARLRPAATQRTPQ